MQKMNHLVPLIHKVTTALGVGGIKREENWTTYPIPIRFYLADNLRDNHEMYRFYLINNSFRQLCSGHYPHSFEIKWKWKPTELVD